MSLYNRNNTTASNPTNAGHHTGYQQMENDFIDRNTATPNQVDTCVQLTRPTSKTALLVRQRRAMLEQLSCFICKGYLIDATTIDECMDSFCKSCIVPHLNHSSNCPKCGVDLQYQQNPLSGLRSDKVLQDIVYKLIPGLYDDEMRRRREFYREHYGAISDPSDDDDESSNGSLNVGGSSLIGEQYGVISHPKPFYKPSDNIDLSIEPQTRGDRSTIYYDNQRQCIVTCFTGSLQQRDLNSDGSTFSSVESQMFKTYLRCPARLTVLQLKKFIAAKFNIYHCDMIRLLYLNESLKEEYSLIDVAYIYDWRGLEHMQLFYIIERDLSKTASVNDTQYQDRQGREPKVARRSIGISTQTIKRVCIDPQPKYYEEKNNNTIADDLDSGRSMRPRVTVQGSASTATLVPSTNKTPLQAGPKTSSVIRTKRECKEVATISANNDKSATIISPPALPYVGRNSTTISVSGTSQSSLVTLASFTKTGHMSTNTGPNPSSATSISRASRGIFNSAIRSDPNSKVPTSPQLAFSFVTERGITIVRRVNNQVKPTTADDSDERTDISSLVDGSISAIKWPAANSKSYNDDNPTRGNDHTLNDTTATHQPSTSQSCELPNARHQVKVKPVYKTFVDPTKLKSPNLKKLGFTARH